MLEIEKAALRCLLTEVSFGVFSQRKHFVRDLGHVTSNGDPNNFRMTKKQALYFWKIVDVYRRQISNKAVKHFAAQRVLTGELPEFYTDGDIRVIPPKPPRSITRKGNTAENWKAQTEGSVSETAHTKNLFT